MGGFFGKHLSRIDHSGHVWTPRATLGDFKPHLCSCATLSLYHVFASFLLSFFLFSPSMFYFYFFWSYQFSKKNAISTTMLMYINIHHHHFSNFTLFISSNSHIFFITAIPIKCHIYILWIAFQIGLIPIRESNQHHKIQVFLLKIWSDLANFRRSYKLSKFILPN